MSKAVASFARFSCHSGWIWARSQSRRMFGIEAKHVNTGTLDNVPIPKHIELVGG
jgi:hypothetical protein